MTTRESRHEPIIESVVLRDRIQTGGGTTLFSGLVDDVDAMPAIVSGLVGIRRRAQSEAYSASEPETAHGRVVLEPLPAHCRLLTLDASVSGAYSATGLRCAVVEGCHDCVGGDLLLKELLLLLLEGLNLRLDGDLRNYSVSRDIHPMRQYAPARP